jgi:hypothetical protein
VMPKGVEHLAKSEGYRCVLGERISDAERR